MQRRAVVACSARRSPGHRRYPCCSQKDGERRSDSAAQAGRVPATTAMDALVLRPRREAVAAETMPHYAQVRRGAVPVGRYRPRAIGRRSQSLNKPACGRSLLTAGCRLPVAGCRLPVASCQLPVASCQKNGSSTQRAIHRSASRMARTPPNAAFAMTKIAACAFSAIATGRFHSKEAQARRQRRDGPDGRSAAAHSASVATPKRAASDCSSPNSCRIARRRSAALRFFWPV